MQTVQTVQPVLVPPVLVQPELPVRPVQVRGGAEEAVPPQRAPRMGVGSQGRQDARHGQ